MYSWVKKKAKKKHTYEYYRSIHAYSSKHVKVAPVYLICTPLKVKSDFFNLFSVDRKRLFNLLIILFVHKCPYVDTIYLNVIIYCNDKALPSVDNS